MYKAIIVDDDFMSREVLKLKLEKFPEISVRSECENLVSAIKDIHAHKPDLIFLDIELSMESGLDIFNYFEKPNFEVICVTGYSEYAIDALRKSVFDYLVKPLQDIDFEKALNHFIIKMKNEKQAVVDSSQNNQIENEGQLSLHTAAGYNFYNIKDIIRFKANGNHSVVHLKNGRQVTSSKLLKYFESKLAHHGFVRINRQDLVNLSCVSKLSRGRYPLLELSNGDQLQVSDRKRKLMRELILQ